MSKGVRIYVHRADRRPERYAYNSTVGIHELWRAKGVSRYLRILAVGCEEGAMTVHFERAQ